MPGSGMRCAGLGGTVAGGQCITNKCGLPASERILIASQVAATMAGAWSVGLHERLARMLAAASSRWFAANDVLAAFNSRKMWRDR
jgi:hypothetical protein